MKTKDEAEKIMEFLRNYCTENDLNIEGKVINQYEIASTYPGEFKKSRVELNINFDCEKWMES